MPGWFVSRLNISAPSTNPACMPITPAIQGHLLYDEYDEFGVKIDSGEVSGATITVKYNGTELDTAVTNLLGFYCIGNLLFPDKYILEASEPDAFTLTAEFAGIDNYVLPDTRVVLIPATVVWTNITIEYCKGDEDLAAGFWISKWRVPGDIEADTYGALLCIDPNGLRLTNRGPVIFLLDDLNFSPGLTEKSGVMRSQINDNATDDTHPEGRVDMELLREGTIWIQDNDEFWVGVQRGPDPGGNEPHGSWNPSGGGDGEGAGRQWLMGGYISKRYYRYGADGEITAAIIGKDYMDVWKDQIFGSPSLPRNYTEATDLRWIAEDILDDVNAFLLVPGATKPLGWTYSAHPTYFPATAPLTQNCGYWATICTVADNSPFWAGPALIWDDDSPAGEIVTIISFLFDTDIDFMGSPIQQILGYWVGNDAKIAQLIGVEWKKEFNQEAADKVMTDICDEASYEWRIDYRRRVMLYPRTSAPPAPSIRFTTNIRDLPEIVMGDTTERITHVIVTDAAISSIPPDIDAWCENPDTWPDLSNNPRGYSAASMPAPANPADNIYADPTLIFDDEVASALCFQNELAHNFDLNLSIYRDASGDFQYGQLHLDLREWQKLKFRFRHATRIEPGTGNIYRLQLHTGGVDLTGGAFFNNRYQYYFGQGTQEIDTIDSNEWTEIELLLPEVDVNGNVTNLNGWTAHDAWDVIHGIWVPPDPTDINWVSIFVSCSELNPGHGPGQALLAPALAGEEYLRVLHPEYFASGSTRKTFQFPNTYILEDSGDSEDVRIRVVGLWGLDNLELDKGVINDYTVPHGATVSVRGGWTICFSQLHFERKLRYAPSATAPTPPYRYRMMISKEMENLNEAVARAEGIIAQEEEAMRPVRALIDGDPRFEAGYSSRLYLNVDPFDNFPMFIDDIQYELGPDLDLRITLLLGEGDRRSRELTEFSLLDAHSRQLRNLGLGRSKTRVDK